MNRIFIIAEAGVNHNGNMEIAKHLVDAAAEAGADAVKFQTFRAGLLVSKQAELAEYQRNATGKDSTQYEMLKRLELSRDIHQELSEYCRKRQIIFLSTPFDLKSIELLESIGMEVYKIPSGEITNLPYLRKIGSLRKKVIMSTGMCDMKEIEDAIQVLRVNGTQDIAVMHCNTQYPTPMEDVNLNAMITMRENLNVPIGYSDHTSGIEVPIAAAALGAEIIEKHFTLDKGMEGPDHKASLEPQELKAMVAGIRNIEKALGNYEKRLTESEKDNIKIVRKSIVASRVIKQGEVFSEANITAKRPGTGISPMLWDEVIGRKAKRDFETDEMIEL